MAPSPADPLPPLKMIAPETPFAAVPDEITTAPVLPELEVPDLNTSYPLIPLVPLFCVSILILPDDLDVETG